MKRVIKANTDKLQGSNGQYAYKGFTILRDGSIWTVRIANTNEVIRRCSSLKEAIDRIDNQTI